MMLFNHYSIFAFLGLFFLQGHASPILSHYEACAPIHILAGRGSNQPRGEGTMEILADAIVAEHPGTTREAIDYPAWLFPYDRSSSLGTAAVTLQLTSYVERCPNSTVVLLGYSQGAHIMLDSLCGGGGVRGLGPATPPVSADVGSKVAAVVGWGDPRHLANQGYNAGNSDGSGIFPRLLPEQSCEAYASRIKDYCSDNDPFCDDGFKFDVHSGYDERYLADALAFVDSKIGLHS